MRARLWTARTIVFLAASLILAGAGFLTPTGRADTPAAASGAVPLTVALGPAASSGAATQDVAVAFPGEARFYLRAPGASWIGYGALEFDVTWPADAPADGQVLVHVKDWDYFWYQNLLPGFLVPGKKSHFTIDLRPGASGWEPVGHHGAWNLRVLMEPKEVGILVFGKNAYSGRCVVSGARVTRRDPDTTAPAIANLRANVNRLACFEKFEATFELPDRYPDPFDPAQVAVTAEFVAPGGQKVTVDGFYGCQYYRVVDPPREEVYPQGVPYWRVRFAPTVPGVYRYTVRVKDRYGEAQWGPASFLADPPKLPGYLRVSTRDPRYFEFRNGAPFFPIGHNVRSPFDTRMDGVFPWKQRWPEGSAVYTRYFKTMSANGENFGEVWTAAWSLGLEWSPTWRGYHGIGQYNLFNAWELDRVLDDADKYGIYLNLVIHNHGKFSSFSDPEWDANPFNVANGGYLDAPEDYFTDPRALADYRKLVRYMIARWGWSSRIFAWELWSELDLTGSGRGGVRSYRRPEVVEWHQNMARYIRNLDPNGHLIATHVCGDFNNQNPAIIALPEMTHCPVDAYHGSPDPTHIVSLLRSTAEFNNPYGKPVMVTEFGGSPHAGALRHIVDELHAALWASTCTPIAGTPLNWWWQVIDEENLYPEFLAISRFMKGEDRRDPDLVPYMPRLLRNGEAAVGIDVQCLRSRKAATGWIFLTEGFPRRDPLGATVETGVSLELTNLQEGSYDVEFWDTSAGRPVAKTKATTQSGNLSVPVPAFARDTAFKVRAAK